MKEKIEITIKKEEEKLEKIKIAYEKANKGYSYTVFDITKDERYIGHIYAIKLLNELLDE